MPIYEYVAHACQGPTDCPRRFAFRQRMDDAPMTACQVCGAPLERILSAFSAASDGIGRGAAATSAQAKVDGPPATLHNVFGGGLGTRGCGHDHSR